MGEFFARDYHGAPFELFGPAHLIALGLVALVIVALCVIGRRLDAAGRMRIRRGFAVTLVVVEVSWHVWNAATGQWTAQTMLPLHLCSALVWLSAVMMLTGNYRIYEFAYLLGIAGASQALLTPDAGVYGFPHFRFFQVILSHGSIVGGAIFMTVVEGYRPTPRSLLRVLLFGNLYMAFVGLVNWLVGSNYLFIAHKPETASLLDVLPAWPWYILWIEAIGAAAVLLLYSPFAVKDWKSRATAQKTPSAAG
ncbi:MAG: TIGR02206 family membrane protein [Chloroflexi bacterium]|nr:TIGR02206 family membrane protein [Chloroflexota bacterium]